MFSFTSTSFSFFEFDSGWLLCCIWSLQCLGLIRRYESTGSILGMGFPTLTITVCFLFFRALAKGWWFWCDGEQIQSWYISKNGFLVVWAFFFRWLLYIPPGGHFRILKSSFRESRSSPQSVQASDTESLVERFEAGSWDVQMANVWNVCKRYRIVYMYI